MLSGGTPGVCRGLTVAAPVSSPVLCGAAVGDKYCESDKCNVLSVVDPSMQTETPPESVLEAAARALKET